MKALLVGSGAREHAIAENLVNSGAKLFSFVSGKNPGILKLSESWKQGDLCDLETIKKYALKNDISIAIIGPEAPLAEGLVDTLISDGIDCVGPRKALARLESDKAFARTLMETYKIDGCPEFHIFQNGDEASQFILSSDKEWAIKPSGLTGGKGVKMMGEHLNKEEAAAYAKEIVEFKIGASPLVVLGGGRAHQPDRGRAVALAGRHLHRHPGGARAAHRLWSVCSGGLGGVGQAGGRSATWYGQQAQVRHQRDLDRNASHHRRVVYPVSRGRIRLSGAQSRRGWRRVIALWAPFGAVLDAGRAPDGPKRSARSERQSKDRAGRHCASP